MVLHIGLYFLFLITSVRISICLWLPNPLSGQFAFPEAHFHGVHFSEGKKKKKLVNSNIKYKKRPRSECASTINTLPSTCTSAPGTAGKPFHLKSLIVNFLIYKMGVIERKKKEYSFKVF